MNVPDFENLDERSYFLFSDTWKLDWNKGVQVPINNNGQLETPKFRVRPLDQQTKKIDEEKTTVNNTKFEMPSKYLCPFEHKSFNPTDFEGFHTQSQKVTSQYDCDDTDLIWLSKVNRAFPKNPIEFGQFENIIENFEIQSHEKFVLKLEKLKKYNIEFDDDIVCDVCRSPESETDNEMVFCDGCNICVHQACYGIERVPEGSWLCGTCAHEGAQFKPECLLCPNREGSMKPTRNARHWCHVSCALWTPEVRFGNESRMEPVVNLQQIPEFRWKLLCELCKKNKGCCVECSYSDGEKCQSAFHITCAFKHGLIAKNESLNDENKIEFKAYCSKHTKIIKENEAGKSNQETSEINRTQENKEHFVKSKKNDLFYLFSH